MACVAMRLNPATATPGNGGMQAHAQLPAVQQSGVACLVLPGNGAGGVCACAAVMTAACSWHAACSEGLSMPTAVPSSDGDIGNDVVASADPLRIRLMHNITRQRAA